MSKLVWFQVFSKQNFYIKRLIFFRANRVFFCLNPLNSLIFICYQLKEITCNFGKNTELVTACLGNIKPDIVPAVSVFLVIKSKNDPDNISPFNCSIQQATELEIRVRLATKFCIRFSPIVSSIKLMSKIQRILTIQVQLTFTLREHIANKWIVQIIVIP